jgi:hypothetical protein
VVIFIDFVDQRNDWIETSQDANWKLDIRYRTKSLIHYSFIRVRSS